MLYAEPCKKGQSMTPLLIMATGRGRLLELLAQRLRPDQPQMADTAFTVGIMSLMDALFAMPMEEFLQQIAVVDEVADALLHRKGFYGELLHLAEYLDPHRADHAPAGRFAASARARQRGSGGAGNGGLRMERQRLSQRRVTRLRGDVR